MGLIIIMAIVSVVLGFFLEALALYLTTKILKIGNAPYKKALKILIIFLIASFILAVILGILFSAINIGFLGNIVLVILGFFIANFLYKKYYQTGTNKNIKIYVVKLLLSAVGFVATSFLVILPIRMFVFQPFTMQGASMEPNLKDGQYMLFNEFDKNYQRGEVVVFKYPKDEKQFFLRRIIALPGEKVEIRDGIVYINGKVLNEGGYISKDIKTLGNISVTLAGDEYFVMRDNRSFSSDSRSWGSVAKNLIVGKYLTTLSIPTN
jgi:signal peptidase I